MQCIELRQLLLSLYPFRCDHDPHRTSEIDDGSYDPSVGTVSVKAHDKAPVDLDVVDRQALQVTKRRISSSEIVEGEADTDGLE